MARVTLRLDEVSRSQEVDHEKLDATSEEGIHGYMIEDGEDPDALPDRFKTVLPPALIRR